MITIPPLGPLNLAVHSSDAIHKGNLSRNGSVLELIMGSREHGSRDSREGSAGPPSRQSSNASVSSVSSLMQDCASSGSQFFEVLYLGKIKTVSHRKAPPSFIDDVVEKIRVYNETEQQKRQTSLPVPCTRAGGIHLSKSPCSPTFSPSGSCNISPTSSNSKLGSSSWLMGTRVDEEESPQQVRDADSKDLKEEQSETLSILTRTEEALINISARMEMQANGNGSSSDVDTLSPGSFRARTSSSGSEATYRSLHAASSLEPMRGRASSMGSSTAPWRRTFSVTNTTADYHRSNSQELNRTMLFQISRSEVRLISPDKKSLLLSKPFKDISHCSQGKKHGETFGFICREANSDNNVCYVFKCQNNNVADEIMAVLKQAFHSAAEALRRVHCNTCEHCPIVWLNKLILDIEGLSPAKMQSVILKRILALPENDQQELVAKFQGAEISGTKQQNELLMLLLRAHCETRQLTHVHDTAEQRHEFLSQYLDRGSGAIFQKAKRSLTSSFDQLLKRKSKDQDSEPVSRENSLPNGVAKDSILLEATPTKQNFRYDIQGGLCQSPLITKNDLPPPRPRSSTLGTSGGETIKKELQGMLTRARLVHSGSDVQERDDKGELEQQQSLSKTPIMDIFLKMGASGSLPVPAQENTDRTPSPRKAGSWRQAIFQQVVTPNSGAPPSANDLICGIDSQNELREKRTGQELRDLWKWAIKQQILLIRMERENKRIRVRQEEMTLKRIKINYDELQTCPREVQIRWEGLLTGKTHPDYRSLHDMIRAGVPKPRRGDAWQLLLHFRSTLEETSVPGSSFLYDQQQPVDIDDFPHLEMPYEELLHQLTSHQHAILIDLGRTFPSHPYFSTPLGPGQLALYNLLKAYSLLDNQVGYCQGLSFIAGVLLLHTEEETAYVLLRHLMIDLGLRRQYLPDMAQLQVQLYQMTRLLRDLHRDLYEHLEENDVTSTLYAAPWFLTLFASQFPLGFVVRVFDLIYLLGISTVFRVAVALLADHKDMLLQCRNFEQIMDYMKTTLPSVGASQMERVFNDALDLDISRQLAAYEVEYHVFQEEMAAGVSSLASPQPANAELLQKVERLEKSNEILQKQMRELQGQLHTSRANARVLEANLTANQAMCTRLERQLHDCEADRVALLQLVTDLTKRLPRGEELVIPPCLVKCFEENKNKGLINVKIGPNLHLSCEDQGLTMKQCHSDHQT